MAKGVLESVTRQIQQSVDIVEIVSETVALRRQGQNLVGLCPFHKEKTPSLNVSPAKQIFKCFGCGAGGDVFTFLQLREKVGFAEARRLLANRAGIRLETRADGSADHEAGKLALLRTNEWAKQQFRKWLQDPNQGLVAREYLRQRQLSDRVVETFGLGYAPAGWDMLLHAGAAAGLSSDLLLSAGLIRQRSSAGGYRDTFHHRLMFPISDASNQVIGFGGRTLGEDRAKYLNTPDTAVFDKGRHLYGLSLARQAIADRGRAIVVEGYTDCMMAHQFGFAETVATLGTALTADHVRVLQRYTDNVYLVFDSDEAGRRAADRGLEIFLTQQLDVRLVQVPEGKDPCDFLLAKGSEAFEATLKTARSSLEFKWRTVSGRYGDATSGPARKQAVDEFLRLVATSAVFRATDAIQRGLVLNELGKLLGIPAVDLHRQVARVARRLGERSVDTGRAGGETSPTEAARPGSIDAEQRALREILEVLINEPGYHDGVGEHFDVARFEDPDLRRVATIVVEMARCFGEFDVKELIARMEEPKYARLITDLQQAGESRGNYGATIEQAVRRLQERHNERLSKEAADRLYRDAKQMSTEDQDPLLVALTTRAKQRRSPLPLNMSPAKDRS